MNAAHEGAARSVREAVANAQKIEEIGGIMSTWPSAQNAVMCLLRERLAADFKSIDPSIFIDIDRPLTSSSQLNDENYVPADRLYEALILANDRASLYTPLIWTERALRIDRAETGQQDIVIPLAAPDAAQRLAAALGQVIEHFDSWSHGVAARGRKRAG